MRQVIHYWGEYWGEDGARQIMTPVFINKAEFATYMRAHKDPAIKLIWCQDKTPAFRGNSRF